MRNCRVKYYKILIIGQLLISLIFLYNVENLIAQQKIVPVEKATISGGAKYSIELEKAKQQGYLSKYSVKGSPLKAEKFNTTSAFTTYAGINFDEDADTVGYYQIPPDPYGAVGTTHLVSVVNTAIQFFTKNGILVDTKRLGKNATTDTGSFFESLSPTTGTFDPKVIWDQYLNRFVVVALEQSSSPKMSRILLAVSANNDPTGTWYFNAINSVININSKDSWADYPGLAVDDKAVYVTTNMFQFAGSSNSGSRVWIINKTPFYTGGAASVNVYDQFALASVSGYSTTQPAHMFGILAATQGTYLVSANWVNGNTDYLSVINVTDPVGSPIFTNTFVSLGDINNTGVSFPSGAPQSGTSTTIDAGDSRLMNAVWRNNTLWACNTVNPPNGTDANQATAHWYEINTSGSLSLLNQGNVGGEDIATGTYTYYPSIAVNSSNAIVIGFTASAPSIFAGAYAAGRLSTDAAGTIQGSQTIQAGLDYYIRTFSGSSNRWGDFSSSSVDPSDDQTFYVFNEYAMGRGTILSGTDDGRWATLFGVFPATELPVELINFSSAVNKGVVNLFWKTATETNNYGFEVERSVVSNQQSGFKKIGFVTGAGNSNSPKNYSFMDQPTDGTKFSYRLKQIDYDGNYKYYDAITITLTESQTAELMQNSPNPFNPSTAIRFFVPNNSFVSIKIYDMLGKEVTTLINGQTNAGYHIVYWAGKDKFGNDVSSGVYLYRLTAGSFNETKKMLMMK